VAAPNPYRRRTSLRNVIRRTHRWLSMAFTAGVIVNLTVYSIVGKDHPPAFWVNLLVLVPVFFLLVSGLYLFVMPYLGNRAV
jgi:hypothetical protein